jgi:hypothetical protein
MATLCAASILSVGQGMTVACMESLALRECLLAGTQGSAKRFLRAASRVIDTPWQIAVGSDLQHPRVEGKRTAQVRFINWYIAKFFQAAQHDGVLATKFLEVANLMQPPTALLSPGIALQVWKIAPPWVGQTVTAPSLGCKIAIFHKRNRTAD